MPPNIEEKSKSGFDKLQTNRSSIPAVTHVDDSARIQTISKERNGFVYDLLKSFENETKYLLNDLKETFSFTFLFISHDLSVVKYMSDRVIILNKGVIEESNETDHLFANPKKDYTKNLLLANDY